MSVLRYLSKHFLFIFVNKCKYKNLFFRIENKNSIAL